MERSIEQEVISFLTKVNYCKNTDVICYLQS